MLLTFRKAELVLLWLTAGIPPGIFLPGIEVGLTPPSRGGGIPTPSIILGEGRIYNIKKYKF